MKELLMAVLAFLGLSSPALPSPTPLPTGSLQYVTEIVYREKPYIVYSYALPNHERLTLNANFDNRESAQTLKKRNDCTFLINGGFYSTSNKPIGWWTSAGVTLSEKKTNALFNGFVYSRNDEVKISSRYPQDVTWGLQTGPVLFEEGKIRKLAIRNDEMRRRMAVVIAADGRLFFLAVTLKNSAFEGPYLVDLPGIIGSLDISVVDAINLDGGSASAFLSPYAQLNEANPIGSFFCYNPDNDFTR